MASLIQGKKEIINIAEGIAADMGIEKQDIANSDRCYDIYILAVKEYDLRNREDEIRKLRNLI